MRKLILEEWISLDGYTCDKEGKLDFFAPHIRTSYDDPERMAFRESIDTILLGRNTYAQFATLWPHRTAEDNILAVKMNTAEKIVCSRSLTEAPWGNWKTADIESGDILARISQLRSGTGGAIIVWGSISLAQHLMKANVIDEYHIHICPVLTGGGRRLFADDLVPSSITLLATRHYGSGIVHLHYQKQ